MTSIHYKKSLGQHFLHDENICRKIVNVLHIHPNMQLLEIGPGTGALTKYLLQLKDVNFKAIEIDREKIAYLETHYPAIKNKLINENFLKSAPPFTGSFSVIGNFPYNISSQILFHLLDWKEQVNEIVGMFQKEVAKRIASPPGNKDYGVLSVLVQAYFKVEYLFEVNENCFTPPPKVKSAMIRITPLEEPNIIPDEKKFKMLVKAAFLQRRKMLRHPLKPYFEKEQLTGEIFSKRAEQLSVQDFVDLSRQMVLYKF